MSLLPWVYQDFCSGPVKMRLFCLPYAGGGASLYRDWQALMPAGVEVCRLQFPAREERISEPPLTSIYELVDNIVRAIRPLLDKPFVIFGHSMGGIVSHRLAYCLQLLGKIPQQVFIAAVRPPHIAHPKPIHQLDDKGFKQSLLARKRTSREILDSDELMTLLMPMLRADFTLAETYRVPASARLHCDLVALCGAQDDTAAHDVMQQWRVLTTGQFDLIDFDGGHFFVQADPNAVLNMLSHTLQLRLKRLHDKPTATDFASARDGEIQLVF